MLEGIDFRVSKLTRSYRNQQEFCQVLRYQEGQFYKGHTDYFDPRFYQNDPAVLQNIQNGERNRLITVLWYLSDVKEGGYTIFPRSFNNTQDKDDCSSEVALKVPPKKGDVIIFYSLFADGSVDPASLHGACPVGKGETKWAANKWIWTHDMGFLKNFN